MLKTLAFLAAFLPSAALATCTTTATSQFSVTVVCTSANESAPSIATDGLSLAACKKGVSVFLAADSTKTLSGTGTVKIYVYDPTAAAWGEVPILAQSVTASAVRYQGFPAFSVSVADGRIAAIPSSVGVSSGGSTIYLRCQ